MKKILICLLALLIATSCSNKSKNLKEYNPNELEYFDGFVLIGMTWSKDGSRKCFYLQDTVSKTQYTVDVSDKIFESYKLGDTIHWENPSADISDLGYDIDTVDFNIEETLIKTITKNGHEYVLTIEHSKDCPCINHN